MNRLLLLVLLLVVPVFCLGQDTISDANRLYEEGNYMEAKLIYVRYKHTDPIATKRYKECLKLDDYYKSAKELFNKGSYQKSARVCDMILAVNPKDPKAFALKRKCNDAVENKRQERDSLLEKARVECSVKLIDEFKSKYSKQKKQLAKADSILADIPIWQVAVLKNTKEAYQEYLAKTPYYRYQLDAEYNIGKIECEETWKRIVKSRRIADFEKFIQMYEKYKLHNDEAYAHINLLTADDYSSNNSYAKAFSYYDSAYKSGKVKFLRADMNAYEKSKDYFAYENAKSEEDLIKYMADYKGGFNYNLASAKLSCLRADRLTENSTKSERRDVKNLAKTDDSKEYVYSVLRRLKEERRITRRKKYGSCFTYGVGADLDMQSDVFSWSAVACAKYGRYVDFGSIAIGVGYREYKSMHKSDEDDLDSNLFGRQIVVPVELRINLFKLNFGAGFYMGTGTEFGYTIKEGENFDANILEKSTITYYPVIGMSSRYVDCSLYYKRFAKNLFKNDGSEDFVNAKEFFGIKFNCYF